VLSNANVGFQLLLKAGWTVGKGLGRDESGMLDPILATMTRERRGIGAASLLTPLQARLWGVRVAVPRLMNRLTPCYCMQNASLNTPEGARAAVRAAGGNEGAAADDAAQQQPAGRKVLAPDVTAALANRTAAQLRALADEELAQESMGHKLTVHRVRDEIEREVARDKAIRATLSQQFNSQSDCGRLANTDPLSRVSRRVTAANPLLDDGD